MLEFLNEKLDGNAWEELCNKCYRMRYQELGYQYVPAKYLGDNGIEGFIKTTGIVYQCYYPEKEYTDNELYRKQCDKVSKDIKKLINNGDKLKKMGVRCVKEWHFVTPEYRDKRLLEHCEKKRNEVLKEKKKNGLDYIDDDFQIIIKVEEDFITELNRLIYLKKDYKLDLAIKHTGDIDWMECPSDKVENIKRKIEAIMPQQDAKNWEDRYKRVVSKYIDYYVKGIGLLNKLQISCPEFYEKLLELENACRDEVELKCDLNDDSSLNKDIFMEILDQFGKDIKNELGELLTIPSIAELKNDLVSGWLANCPMDFR
ncbi:hypothetical protein [Clostridium botulinum]